MALPTSPAATTGKPAQDQPANRQPTGNSGREEGPARIHRPVGPRLSGLLFQKDNSMLPQQNHPLTRAYLLGARSNTTQAYAEALRLIRACEADADQLTIDQCKLAADVMIERGEG